MAIKLKKPTVDTNFEYSPQRDGVIVFDFSTTDVTLSQNGNNLVLNFDDGGQIILNGFYTTYTKENMPLFDIEGTIIEGETFFTALGADDIMPAASPLTSPPVNSGASLFTTGDGGDLMNGLNALGGLTLAQTAASGNLFIPFGGATGESASANIQDQAKGSESFPPFDLSEKNIVVKVEISTDTNNDGYINKNELDESGTVKVTVKFNGDVEKGDEITLTDQNGEEIFRGEITEDMLESGLDIYIAPPTENTDLVITATVTDQAGNSGSGQDSAHIDTTLGEDGNSDSQNSNGNNENLGVKVDITTDGSDNFINHDELKAHGGIKATITVGNSAENGDIVVVTLTDAEGNEYNQELIVGVDVNAGESYEIFFKAEDGKSFPEGNISVSATITDEAGNTASDNDSSQIDSSSVYLSVEIQSGLDNVISSGELSADNTFEVKIGFGTDVAVGDSVDVSFKGQSIKFEVTAEMLEQGFHNVSFDAPTDADGKVLDNDLVVNATITDKAGNSGTGQDNAILESDKTAPILENVSNIQLNESHLTGGSEEQAQAAGYRQSFIVEADGDLASVTIAGQIIGLSGYSENISLEGYTLSDVTIVAGDNGNYTVEYTVTLDKNVAHEKPSTAHTEDEVKNLPSFEISATDSAGNTSSSVTVNVDVLDDVVSLGSVVDTEDDLSDSFETFDGFSRDIVTGYVDMSGDFVELGSRTVNYGDVDIFTAKSVTITEDGIAVSHTSGKLDIGSADGVVEVTMQISFDIRGTSNFMQIDGELINVTSYITDTGETVYLIGKISDANGDGKANDKDPEDYAQEDLYAKVVFDSNTNTWSMEQYKEYSETIVLEFSATDTDGDSTTYKVGVTGTSVGFEPRLISELSESVSTINTSEPMSFPLSDADVGSSLDNTENNSDGNNDFDSGDDIILLDSLSLDSVLSVDGGDRGMDVLLTGENNLSTLKSALDNEGSFLNNMEVIMLGDDMEAAEEIQNLLKNDSDYFTALNNGWTQGEMHEIGDQSYQEFSNGENTVFVLAPVNFSSMASMSMVNSHSDENMFDTVDDDTAFTTDSYEPKDRAELSLYDDSGYDVSRNGVFDLSIMLTDIATGGDSVSDLTSTLEEKGIVFNVIDNSFSLDKEAWSERESGLFINNEEGSIIDSNLLDIQFTNMAN